MCQTERVLRGRYQVVGRLGRGAAGSVYRARDVLAGGAEVAVKVVWHGRSEAVSASLRRELQVLSAVRHPALAAVYDFGRLPAGAVLGPDKCDRPGLFLARQLCPGVDLEAAAVAGDRDLGHVCRLCQSTAEALEVLHRAGLRHGDLKPENAICDDRGRVRLIDFGLAAPEGDPRAAGTPAFMAPELWRGEGVDRRADLYALGVTLVRLAGGMIGEGDAAEPAPLASFRDDVPAALDDLVARLLATDPDDRPPSAAEVASALDRIAADLSAPAVAQAPAPAFVPPVATPVAERLESELGARLGGAGGSAVTVLTGAAGAGKTTVLTELAWRLAALGVEVVRGGEGGRGRPFAVIAPVLAQVAGLTGRPAPDLASVRGPAGGAIADFLADAARTFPIAVLIDDLDRADPSSQAAVEFLARGLSATARVAVVAAMTEGRDRRATEGRDEGLTVENHDEDGMTEGRDRLGTEGRDRGFEGCGEVVVEPLSGEAIDWLVTRTSGRHDPELSAWLAAQTGGNPLHIVHLLEAQAASGFSPAARRQAKAPARLSALAAAKLAARPTADGACVAALAILARPVPAAAVARLLAWTAEVTADVLEGAVSAGLVSVHPGGCYAPARRTLADAALAATDPGKLGALYRRAPEALAAAGAPATLAEACAYAVFAGDVPTARALSREALAELSAAGDHRAALALGQDVLALGGDEESLADPHTRGLRLAVGEAARRSADCDAATGALSALIPPGAAGDAGWAADSDRARVILGRAHDEAGDAAAAEALFRAVTPTSADGAVAARELARLVLKRGDAATAAAIAETAMSRLSGAENQARGDLDAIAAFARGHLADPAAAIARLDAIAAAARVKHALERLEIAQNYAAILAFRRGDYAGARERYLGARAAAEQAGDTVRAGTLRLNIGAVDFHRGDYAACREQLTCASRLLFAAGAKAAAATADKNLGQLLMELGHPEQAREKLAAIDGGASEVIAAGARLLLGVIAWRGGDADDGRARMEEARRQFARLGDGRREADAIMDIAELCLEHRDVDQARSLLDQATPVASAAGELSRRARFLALSAEAKAAAGDAIGAREALAQLAPVAAEIEASEGRHLLLALHISEVRARRALGDESGAQAAREAARRLAQTMAAGLSGADRIAFFSDPRRRGLAAPARFSSPAAAPTVTRTDSDGERVYRLLALYGRLSTETDMDRLLAMVMDAAMELFGAERGLLLLADESGALTTEIARNLPDAETSADASTAAYSRSVAEGVFRTGDPLVSRVAHADPRLEGAASVHALGIASVVCVPVRARGRVTGVLYLESRLRPLDLSDGSLRLLSAFGDQVAVVLGNARLLSDNARHVRDLDKAREEIESLLVERTELLSQRTEELALARRDLAETHRRFLDARGAFGLVGRSQAMEQVFRMIERLAGVDVPVLITGESGTGKELVARALHAYGPRKDRPLVSVNCAALPEGLLESELFGHVRGAFTGADRARRGLIEAAAGGSLFLDEVGDTPARMQASLLRALQEKVIRPVGGERDLAVDVRFIAATNRRLEDLVATGAFRRDLFYRLNVVAVSLPPLRERAEDIPLLVDHFLEVIAERTGIPRRRITRGAMSALVRAPWPGNIRQLEHALTTACVLADGNILDENDLAPALARTQSDRAPAQKAPTARHDGDRQRILDALEASAWNKSQAARRLGMPRRTFYRRLAALDIT
ncbi:MAG TPA: sigma 54-interacting transcriptional regulator [Kofleriaceae bacterium]|nr:sigma 54-interacting transcriptional regulator [Kofleriaceae bacterium]